MTWCWFAVFRFSVIPTVISVHSRWRATPATAVTYITVTGEAHINHWAFPAQLCVTERFTACVCVSVDYRVRYYEFTGVSSCWDVVNLYRLLWACVMLNVLGVFLGIITAAILGAFKDLVSLDSSQTHQTRVFLDSTTWQMPSDSLRNLFLFHSILKLSLFINA